MAPQRASWGFSRLGLRLTAALPAGDQFSTVAAARAVWLYAMTIFGLLWLSFREGKSDISEGICEGVVEMWLVLELR